MILGKENLGYAYDGASTPLYRYTPVETTVNAVQPDSDFHRHVHDLGQDCVNQGGISNVRLIRPAERDDSAIQKELAVEWRPVVGVASAFFVAFAERPKGAQIGDVEITQI